MYHQDFDQKLGGGGAETTSHPDQRRQPGFRNDAGLPKCFVTAQHSLDPGCRHPLRRGESSAGKARFRSPADCRKLKTSPRRRSTGEGGRVVLTLETGTGHEALSRTNVVPCVPAGKLRADVDERKDARRLEAHSGDGRSARTVGTVSAKACCGVGQAERCFDVHHSQSPDLSDPLRILRSRAKGSNGNGIQPQPRHSSGAGHKGRGQKTYDTRIVDAPSGNATTLSL